MSEPIEIASYQLGIRFAQCQILAQTCLEPVTFDLEALPPGDYIVSIQRALVVLGSAFRQFAAAAKSDATVVAMEEAIIEECAGIWRNWAQRPISELVMEYGNESPFLRAIARLRALADRSLTVLGDRAAQANIWFEIGNEIANGRWGYAWSPEETGNRPVGKTPAKTTRTEPRRGLVWTNGRRLENLLAQARCARDTLCPVVTRDLALSLLPYVPDTDYFDLWARVEAGLISLAEPLGQTVSVVPPSPADEEQGGNSRLTVDIENECAQLDGVSYGISRDVAIYLTALLGADGDWVGPKDIVKRCPEFQGRRPDRTKRKVPKPIRALVETQSSKGSRIPRSALRRES